MQFLYALLFAQNFILVKSGCYNGPEITTCYYEGLLQEYVMLCYGSLQMVPACSAKDSHTKWSLLHHVV
jgi:hypothetical protein